MSAPVFNQAEGLGDFIVTKVKEGVPFFAHARTEAMLAEGVEHAKTQGANFSCSFPADRDEVGGNPCFKTAIIPF